MEELLHAGIHWSFINFVIFVGLLFFFLKKPVAEFWVSRSEDLKARFGEAENLSQAAKKEYQEWNGKISAVEEDAKNLILSLQREGDLEKTKLMEESVAQANQIRSDGVKIAQQEVQKAVEALKVKTAELAVGAATGFLKDSLNASDQSGLIEGYLKGVEKEGARL